MGEPWGIVVVPTKAGLALTAYGPCGARAPLLIHYTRRGVDAPWEVWHGTATRLSASLASLGLPLRWDGALVPEGWDRARRVWSDTTSEPDQWPSLPSLVQVLGLARALETAGLCRVVLLDLVDGAVVERAP